VGLGVTGGSFGATGVLTIGKDFVGSFTFDIVDAVSVTRDESVDGGAVSADDCVKKFSNKFEQICRRDFFDSFVS
jgi:hypothetical protein